MTTDTDKLAAWREAVARDATDLGFAEWSGCEHPHAAGLEEFLRELPVPDKHKATVRAVVRAVLT
jgi:hypothetical protein